MRKLIIIIGAAIAALAIPGVASADVARVPETTTTVVKTTAKFTVLQPRGQVGQFEYVWKHDFTVDVAADGTFIGTADVTDGVDSTIVFTESVTGKFTDGGTTADNTVSFDTTPLSVVGATFKVTNAPTNNTTVIAESNWTNNIIEMRVSEPVLTIITADTVTNYKNHGAYVSAMGGGTEAAQSPIGKPIKFVK